MLNISREKAQVYIENRRVEVNGSISSKASLKVSEDDKIVVDRYEVEYVGRGSHKLKGALEDLDISLKGKVILDVGSSTGGFTQVALIEGASKVYAVDVGNDQMSLELSKDPRVLLKENQDIRSLDPRSIGKVDLIMVDLSFISLVGLFKKLIKFLKEDGHLLTLIKPQFELGSKVIGKKGIASIDLHSRAVERVVEDARTEGLYLNGFSRSIIKGKKGNIEYFGLFSHRDNKFSIDGKDFFQ